MSNAEDEDKRCEASLLALGWYWTAFKSLSLLEVSLVFFKQPVVEEEKSTKFIEKDRENAIKCEGRVITT